MANPVDAGLGGVGIAVEATTGTYLAPTNYVDAETNGLDPKVDIMKKTLFTATRFGGRTARPGKWQGQGPLAIPVGGNHGSRFLRPAFGAVAGMAALTADTVKAATPVTTANGISTITCTNTAAVTYVQGAWLQVNTSTSAELRQILTIAGNGAANTVLTVAALQTNAIAAAGTAVQQIAQLQFTTATTSPTLTSLSVSLQEGGLYEERYAGTFVDKYTIKLGKDLATETVDLYATTKPVRSTVRTPTLTQAETTDVQTPLSLMDSVFVTNQDPIQAGGSTGPSAQQFMSYVDDWSLEFGNNLIKKPFHDLTQTYKAGAGQQSAMVQYTYATVGRPAELEDYIGNLAGSAIPMAVGLARNTATSGAAVWTAKGFYMSNVVLEEYATKRTIGDFLSYTIKGEPKPPTATGDAIVCYVVNADGSTTTTY